MFVRSDAISLKHCSNVTDKTSFAQHWDDLVSDVVKSDMTLSDRPCFEIYHSYDIETGAADLSIYVAVD